MRGSCSEFSGSGDPVSGGRLVIIDFLPQKWSTVSVSVLFSRARLKLPSEIEALKVSSNLKCLQDWGKPHTRQWWPEASEATGWLNVAEWFVLRRWSLRHRRRPEGSPSPAARRRRWSRGLWVGRRSPGVSWGALFHVYRYGVHPEHTVQQQWWQHQQRSAEPQGFRRHLRWCSGLNGGGHNDDDDLGGDHR